MAKLQMLVGSASQTINIFIQASNVTTGAGLAGLVYNTSNLIAYYALPKAAPVAITLATQTVTGAYSSGGFVELDATHCPGLYRLDLPDAALASGRYANVFLSGAANMAQTVLEIELTVVNNQDGTRFALTALPNVASGSAGAIPTTGTGSNQISVSSGQVILQTGSGTGQLDFTSGVVKANATQWLGGTIPAVNVTGVPLVDAKYLLGTIFATPNTAGLMDVNAKQWNALTTVALPLIPTTAGRTLDVSATGEAGLDWANIGSPTTTVGLSGTTVGTITTYTGNTVQTGDSYARIGAAGAGLTAVALTTTQTFNNTGTWTGNITGNLSGSVGSVTGAVGSVTGAVGSVTGAVGSVTGNVGGMTAAGLAGFFTTDTTKVYTDAIAGSVVFEIASNAGGSGGDPWNTALPGAYASGKAGYILGTFLTGDAYTRIGSNGAGLTSVGLGGTQTFNNTGTWTGSITGSVGSVTGAVGSVTGSVGSVVGLTASNLDTTISSRATPANVLTTALTESYAAIHATPTLSQAIFEIRSILAEKSVTATTVTTNKIDGSTLAETFTLNDATTPTAITRAS